MAATTRRRSARLQAAGRMEPQGEEVVNLSSPELSAVEESIPSKTKTTSTRRKTRAATKTKSTGTKETTGSSGTKRSRSGSSISAGSTDDGVADGVSCRDSGSESGSTDVPGRKRVRLTAATDGNTGKTTATSSSTGLGPGTEVIVKRPKARPAGDTPYTDDTIHPNTMIFLNGLKENNNRIWMKDNELDLRAAQADFASFVECISEKLIEVDETIPELPTKDLVFRLHRDVRFSKDKSPFKPYVSAAWSRTGRKGVYAMYYLQVMANGGSMVCGGLWMPSAEFVSLVRDRIVDDPGPFKTMLASNTVRAEFFNHVPENDIDGVVDAFAAMNAGGALKTKPKGYTADQPDLPLIRLRGYIFEKRLKDSEVTVERVIELFTAIEPLVTYLNSVVLPDDESEQDVEM